MKEGETTACIHENEREREREQESAVLTVADARKKGVGYVPVASVASAAIPNMRTSTETWDTNATSSADSATRILAPALTPNSSMSPPRLLELTAEARTTRALPSGRAAYAARSGSHCPITDLSAYMRSKSTSKQIPGRMQTVATSCTRSPKPGKCIHVRRREYTAALSLFFLC